ncbi:MAG: hypothetical protein V5789_03855 [Colwellia sp.]
MEFNVNGDVPVFNVRTYSSHYKIYSNEHENHTEFYLESERDYSGTVSGESLTEAPFHEQDNFVIELTDFVARFGEPNARLQ